MKINNRWKIVLVAAGFNLLFEISLRGGAFFLVNPTLALFIFPVYFTWFIVLEDLVGRLKLQDSHFMLLALILPFGTQVLHLTSDAFGYMPPLVLGINWTQLIWLSLVWYIALQTVMAFYIANRLFPRKEWVPLLNRKGLVIAWAAYLGYGFIFRLGAKTPLPQFSTLIILALITILLLFLFRRTCPQASAPPPKAQKSLLLDILTLVTIAIFVFFSATTTTNPSKVAINLVDYSALNFKIIIAWTTVSAIIIFAYRLYSKKPIPV